MNSSINTHTDEKTPIIHINNIDRYPSILNTNYINTKINSNSNKLDEQINNINTLSIIEEVQPFRHKQPSITFKNMDDYLNTYDATNDTSATSATTDAADTPDAPDTPCAPDAPDTPCAPGAPCVPDAPDAPDTTNTTNINDMSPVIQNNCDQYCFCLLYTSPSPRDLSTSRMPSPA